jgi:NADH-quinone oxidoreductase subunit E
LVSTAAYRQRSVTVARLNDANVVRARELIALYPNHRSATIPLFHLLQEQDGYLTPDGMEHVAELLDLTPAEVRGTASFYEMLHLQPVGRYLVAICTNIACMLDGAYELLEHIEQRLGVTLGGTSSDGLFTLEDTECIALCGNAPCLVVNWRYFGDMTPERWDTLAQDLAAGRLDAEVPHHGTLCRVRRTVGLVAGGAAPTADDKGKAPAPRRRGGAQPAPAPAAVDSAGREVQLATSRTTPAVLSTLDPGGSPPTTEAGAR